jgi:diguanylate cyclase (GGDEF)-like protein
MPETATSERVWRIDRVGDRIDSTQRNEGAEPRSGSEAGSIVSGSLIAETKSTIAEFLPRWNQAVWTWLRSRFQRFEASNAGFEEDVHQLAATIVMADDSSVVEAALLRLARQMSPASRIELIPVPESEFDYLVEAEDALAEGATASRTGQGQSVVEVPLRCGATVCGQLRVRSRTGKRSPLGKDAIRRLTTLCTMAACAMESLGRDADGRRDGVEHAGESRSAHLAPQSFRSSNLVHPSILLHDATFLNAVLPFALNQARRHRESLSLVCVAIDRLSAVQELLGRAEVMRLVRNVGETVGSLIRGSDIVACLDDDRVVAVLPRAPRGGALHVAERICRSIAEKSPADCETPRVTVSIGVATFPSCADNVYSLFDAADEALAWAQNHGRNQAILAPTRRAPAPTQAPLEATAS